MRINRAGLIVPFLLFLIAPFSSRAGEKKEPPASLALREFLKENHPGKGWGVGPLRLDSPEIRQAYKGLDGWYVHSTAPLPPGARIKSVIEAYEARMKIYLEKQISVCALIDREGKVRALLKPTDYNLGLMPVANEAEAKIAAAAILSFHGKGLTGPGIVSAKQVEIEKTSAGWTCQASDRFFAGTVLFNGKGQVTAVSKNYIGPLPP